MSDRNHIAEAFNKHFDQTEKVVEFKEEYANGTGYLDGAEAIPLEQGETAKMIDNYGRRCILVGTLFGTVAVFQRTTDPEGRYVCNYPQALMTYGFHLTGNPVDSEAVIHHLFGSWENNIGIKIKKMIESARVMKYVNDLQHAKTPTND